MGDYSELKTAISNAIKTNGKGEITGEVLQSALLSIVSTIGAYDTFGGIATVNTSPNTDQKVFYLATEAGTYNNFRRGLILHEGITLLYKNGTVWAAARLFDKEVLLAEVEQLIGSKLEEVEYGTY